MLSPAGLVGFSAGRRLQKLSSAPRALARLQFYLYFGSIRNVHVHIIRYKATLPLPYKKHETV